MDGSVSEPECHGSGLGQDGSVTGRIWVRTELSMVGSGTEQSCQLSDLGQNPECHGSDLDQSGNVTGRI